MVYKLNMELSQIFTANPQSALLDEARKQSDRLRMHITGKQFANMIETMDEFETEQKKNLRQKYSRSNKDIFSRIHAPIDKVFSALGGSLTVNIPQSKQKEFNVFLSDIRKSMSLRKWVKAVALPGLQMDPNGLIFIEVDQNGKPYPTYKSTKDIFYYEVNGRSIETVIFNLSVKEAKKYALQADQSIVATGMQSSFDDNKQATRFYRIVDDVVDKIVMWDGKNIEEYPELTIPNYFKKCPGLIISDIYEFDSDLFLSPDSPIVELANSILTQNSVFEIWKNLHMFPKHWRVQSVCPTCQGHKTVSGAECIDCGGTGFQRRTSVRDEIIVPMPDSIDGKIQIPDKFDGYSTPSAEAWELSTKDLDRLYNQMFETMWGYSPDAAASVKVGSDKTATQVLDEVNSKSQRLPSYSQWAESIEKFVIDMCAGLMYGTSYQGCSVKYGDRYILEGPDALWNKYSDQRTKGASQAVLDNSLKDYYESKLQSNPIQLQIAIKQMKVEPWVHLSVSQVQALTDVSLKDKIAKAYFSEWASTLNEMDWIMNTEQKLRQKMYEYSDQKEVEPQKAA